MKYRKGRVQILLLLSLLPWAQICFGQKLEIECATEETKAIYANILKSDQQLRSQIPSLNKKDLSEIRDQLLASDLQNQKILDELVKKCGWPDSDNFFNSSLEAAFLIVHHASYEYQTKYAALLKKSFDNGKIPKEVFELFEQRYSRGNNFLPVNN